MTYCPDPAAWRKGAEAVARNLLQPLILRRLARASFWPRRWPFYNAAPADPAPQPLPHATTPETVAGWLWQAEFRRVMWFGAELEYTTPDLRWLYAELSVNSLLAGASEDPARAVMAGFQRGLPVRPWRPLRLCDSVDQMLESEPWYGAVPFQSFQAVLAKPKTPRPKMTTETSIPALATPMRTDATAAILKRSALPSRTQTAKVLAAQPMRPMRASNVNVLPLVRHQAPRRAMRGRRAGMR